MIADSAHDSAVSYRNFNLCPHCILHGHQALLCRLCEGIPMISRSDGTTFHVLLADRPLPYPLERGKGAGDRISACFWYSHINHPATCATIVILPDSRTNHPAVFRMIEEAADLLADELLRFLGQPFRKSVGPSARFSCVLLGSGRPLRWASPRRAFLPRRQPAARTPPCSRPAA
jgi:hypothetical protein